MAAVTYLAMLFHAAAPEGAPGAKIEPFSLPDHRGQVHALAEYEEFPVLVVAFIGTQCPLARIYTPKLQKIADDFADRGVRILLVDSNRQDSLEDVGRFVREHGVRTPVLIDRGNKVADLFGAVRTPEVFVLDAARTVRYRGRVDDQYGFGLTAGYAKPRLSSDDLVRAVSELLDGKEVSTPLTKAEGCYIGRVPKIEPTGDVTYARDVAPILYSRCVECHREGEVAPFAMTTYEETVGWGETIVEVVEMERMPPWFASPEHGEFANDCRLSDKQKEVLRAWVADGMPEGDPGDLPPLPTFAEGWRIGTPDAVFYMDERPYQVPAEGVVRYQYYLVDPGFTEDVWVQRAEARPGNRGVVHHIIVFALPPGGVAQLRLGDEASRASAMIAAYAPGNSANILPEGSAMLVRAGSKLVFQMHYTPNGSPQEDRSAVGLVYADPASVKKRIRGGGVPGRGLRIPPHAENHRVEASIPIRDDLLLLSMAPHMHLRGKSFTYVAEYPDGSSEVLLDVPRYDFNWQLTYELSEPKRLPAGTRLRCVAHYDNSTGNPANPDPDKTVTWGPQTWDEMMIGFFKGLPIEDDGPGSASPKPAGDERTQRPLRERLRARLGVD